MNPRPAGILHKTFLIFNSNLENLEAYSLKFQEMKEVISFKDLKSLMGCLTKKIPTLSSLVNTCSCRVKEIENAGDAVFEEFQQRCNDFKKIKSDNSLTYKE